MIDVRKKYITGWLILGLFMIYVQVLLGGITRLTGSGLSITEWNVIMGAIPPMNETQWQEMFDKYKQFPQYKIMNTDMNLSGFKSIFFWEYFHRLWARSFGVVFIAGFLYFLYKRWIDKKFAINLLILFCLGGLEAAAGIIMVQSGLKNNPWVDQVSLGIHLMLALLTFSWLLYLILSFIQIKPKPTVAHGLKNGLNFFIGLTALQIFYGALMAGTHAALSYSTWPKIGEQWVPSDMFSSHPVWTNLYMNKATIQFIHRCVAYVLALTLTIFWLLERKTNASESFKVGFMYVPIVVLIQVLLGIITLLSTSYKIPIVWAVSHQGVGIILFALLLYLRFSIVIKKQVKNSASSPAPG